MFPLTPIPPLSPEGWVITMADKAVSISEMIRNLRINTSMGEGHL